MTRRPFRAAMTAAAVLGAAAALAPVASAAPVLFGATGASDTDTLPASNLYTLNPSTGAAASVGSIGKAITGLAYDDTSATLYGVTAGVSLDGTERQLLVINQANGSSTVVGSLGTNEIEDIAFTGQGQLYGWNESGDDLVKIDKATGAVTKVGESNLGVTYGNGLAFNPQGQLYGFLDGDFGHVSRVDPGKYQVSVVCVGGPDSRVRISMGEAATDSGRGLNCADGARMEQFEVGTSGRLRLYVSVGDFGPVVFRYTLLRTSD